MPGIGAIVLAAGGSTRMGQAKQLLQYEGESFLQRACNAAIDSKCQPLVVVLGSSALSENIAHLPVETAINQNWQRGIGSSIRIGMQRLLEISPAIDAAAILLCDQPLINAQTIAKLIDQFRKSKKGVCASSYKNTVGPPVIASSRFFDDLLQLPDDRGAKEIWLKHPAELCTFACEEAANDIDTPADFARLNDQKFS